MCSSWVSDTAYRKRNGRAMRANVTQLPFSFSERSPLCRYRCALKRKGRSSKRKGNHGCPFLFTPAASAAIPAVVCGKTFRPGRANRFRSSGTPESRYCEKATLCLRGYWEMKYSAPSLQQGGLLGRSGACRHKGALPHACRPVRWWIRFRCDGSHAG